MNDFYGRIKEVYDKFAECEKNYFHDLNPATVPKSCGVYAIFDNNDKALYVGRTKKLRQRLCQNHLKGQERSSPIKKYLCKDEYLNDINDFGQAKVWLKANCYFKYIVIDCVDCSNLPDCPNCRKASNERGHVEGLLGFILDSKYIETEH